MNRTSCPIRLNSRAKESRMRSTPPPRRSGSTSASDRASFDAGGGRFWHSRRSSCSCHDLFGDFKPSPTNAASRAATSLKRHRIRNSPHFFARQEVCTVKRAYLAQRRLQSLEDIRGNGSVAPADDCACGSPMLFYRYRPRRTPGWMTNANPFIIDER